MSNRSYLLRLIIPFAVMIVIVVALSGWLIYQSGYATARQQQIDDLARDAQMIAGLLRRTGGVITDSVRERIEEESTARDVRYTLIDSDGRVLLDSHAGPDRLDNHNTRPEVIAARQTGKGQAIRDSATQQRTYVYAATRLREGSGLIIRASRPERMPFHVSQQMIIQLAAAVISAVMIVSVLALMLHRKWIAPVRRLASAADQMAAGQWQTRVEPGGDSELRQFSARLNNLAEQAQKHVFALAHQREDLASLVDSLPDPIIVTTPSEKVLLINEPAARFLQVTPQQASGSKLVSILNEPSLLDVYEQLSASTLRPGTPLIREIRVTRQAQKFTYQAVAAKMPAGGVLLVLRDVTQLAAAVQMKTDFVANASHELRTPIAAIKLAFDTLAAVYAEEPQQAARCISIIDGHLHRLEELLADLLDLSRVEAAEIKPEITQVNGKQLIARLGNTVMPLARKKEIDLQLDVDAELVFESDRRLLDLTLKNLVENSIKYTPAGGTVKLRLWRQHEEDGSSRICLVVSDTGIGIPPQHQERVFERFYQVDAARSGSSGRGTGLGLAIVKHAVHALSGTVKLESTVGRGTTVTCVFPEHHAVAAAV